jgi:protein TonB
MTDRAAPTPAPPEEAARAAQEPLAAPVALAGPRRRSSLRLRLAAFLAALAAHLAVLYWIAREPPLPMAGAGGRLLDAVDIGMVDATALEARPDVRAPPAPATPDAAVESKEGTVESEAAPQQPEQKEQKENKRAPEKPREEEPIPIQPAEAPSVVKPPEKREPQKREKERKEASPAADAGGAAARGDGPQKERQTAPAAASPGAVREYDGYVQAALTRARPKRGFGRGTVRVKFQLSPEGAVVSVEVGRSSGNKRLDDEAVATVRRARFPRPRPGMSDIQRFYEFPIYFR